MYLDPGPAGEIYRLRLNRAAAWIDNLKLPKPSQVLEIGCGAGQLTVELARRGHHVSATDASEGMVDFAQEHVREASVTNMARVVRGDALALPFADTSMDVVVALGVISWVRSPQQAMSEMRRVVKEDGYVLFSAYNAYSLRDLLDPVRSDIFAPLRRNLKRFIPGISARQGVPRPRPRPYRRYDVTRLIAAVGMAPIRSTTLGFGPFTVLWRPILSGTIGVRIQKCLQRLADDAVPGVRSTGRFHLVLARPHARLRRSVSRVSDLARTPYWAVTDQSAAD